MNSGLSAKRQRLEAGRFLPVLASGPSSSSSPKSNRRGWKPSSLASTPMKKQSGGKDGNREKSRSNLSKASLAASIRQKLPRHTVLKALKVQDVTLIRYHNGVQEFEQYLKRRRLKPKDVHSVDIHMATYFADLCDAGSSYNNATYVLFGWLMLRCSENLPDKMLLPQSRAALKGWCTRYPQSSRTGADPLIWHLVALHMCEFSPLLAAAAIVQLDTYARPSELLRVKKQDVIRPSTKHCKYWGIIFGNSARQEKTKTGTQDDTVLFDSTDRPYAKQVLRMVYNRTRRSTDSLFGQTTLSEYEDVMKRARSKAKLGQFSLTPHTVRHSGPSIDSLQKTRHPEEILARGRWRSMKSIQRYQKPGQMLASMNRIGDEIWVQAKAALPKLMRKLRSAL